MGTVMNGKKWAGACVNGKTVSGLVKNGVVFYKKSSISYKRRIMIGDNLSGKTIFQDFPDGFFLVDFSWDTSRVLINSNDIDIYEKLDSMGFYEIYCGGYSNLMYRCDVTGAMPTTKKDVKLGSYSNAIVTEVNENKTYRHLFIEDENIRPLEVGDVITSTTKFYFTFPDDFYGYIENNISPGERLKIVELDNSIGGKFISVENYQGITSTFYLVAFFVNNSSTSDRHIYNYNTNSSFINKSNMTSAFSGTVTNVNKNNQSYQHILVDTTTLGA